MSDPQETSREATSPLNTPSEPSTPLSSEPEGQEDDERLEAEEASDDDADEEGDEEDGDGFPALEATEADGECPPEVTEEEEHSLSEEPLHDLPTPEEVAAADAPTGEPELRAPLTTRSGEPAEIDPAELDPDALKVVLRLHAHGHQAYFVGGCVRDLLLGRKPKDFDVATSATPNEVRATFRNCRLIGRRFRLAHVYFKGGKVIEVSTFRANPTELMDAPGEPEGEEAQAGEDLLITHDNVFGTAEQDARRRDFTMNGLFYDVTEGRVIDYVRGRRDLDLRQIRTIGDAEVRLREDPVRILRAVRFAAKLNLDIESRTYAAMEGAVEDLPRCAPARLLEETFRLIRGGVAAPTLRLLSALDALKILLPPLDAYLKQLGPRREQSFYAFAEALDRRVATGEVLDDAILLATMLVPISRAAPPPPDSAQDGGRPSVAQAIEDLLAGFVQSARLPRRIAERCRMLLLAQRTLSGERRRRTAAFRKHPLFAEALVVFEMTVEATGEGWEQLEAWKAGEVPPPPRAGAAEADGDAPRRRRRRRRRSGGGGGGRRSGEGGGNGASAPSGAGADSGD